MRRIILLVLLAGVAGCVPPPARVETPRTETMDQSCSVDLPVGWIRHYTEAGPMLASRDGLSLQVISVIHRPLDKAFPKTKKAASEAMLASELAELRIAELKAQTAQTAALIVVENVPTMVDGRDGFRVLTSYRTERGLEIHHMTYAVADKSGYYQLDYVAPKLHYFDQTAGDFEKAVASFRIGGKEKTAAK